MENGNLKIASYNWAIDRCINNSWSFAEPLLEYAFSFPVEIYSRISFCLIYCTYEELGALMQFEGKDELDLVKPDGVSDVVWQVFLENDNGDQLERRIRLRLLIYLLELTNANYHLRSGSEYRSIDSLGDAMLVLGEARACFRLSPEAVARANLAKIGALARLKNDPKQAAKQQVKECWDTWQSKPNQYKSKSAFARDMLDKFPHQKGVAIGLESQRVIERWCKEWESEPSQ